MHAWTRTLAALLSAAVAVAWGVGPLDFEVVRPRLGVPAIQRPGELVRVELRDALPVDQGEQPRVLLQGENGQEVELEVVEARRTGARRELWARLPEGPERGAFGLAVELHGHRHAHARAVFVEESRFEDLTVVHLADLPYFLGSSGGAPEGEALMARLVSEINLIAPDLIMISGDLAYVGTWAHFEAALRHFEAFDAPVVAGIGNHEYRGLAAFFTYFGPLHHVVDMGRWRILTLNSGHGRDQLTASQRRWLREAFEEREGRSVLVQLHHPLFWVRKLHVGVPELVDLCAAHDVPAVLAGHWHGDYLFDSSGEARGDTYEFPGTKFVVTTTAGADFRPQTSSSPLHYGYRILRFKGGELESYTYDWDGDGVRDPCTSIPVGKLEARAEGPRARVITNDLNEDLSALRVELWADAATVDLRPTVGELESLRTLGDRTRYRVRVDVPAHSEVRVELEGD